MSESPFIAGVRVAVRQGDYEKWHEKFIDKVHKNGNFTLRGDKQQWKPNSSSWSGAVTWAAFQTGDTRWNRARVEVWSEKTDEDNRGVARKQRYIALRKRFERVHESELTDSMLDAIEAALPVLEKERAA